MPTSPWTDTQARPTPWSWDLAPVEEPLVARVRAADGTLVATSQRFDDEATARALLAEAAADPVGGLGDVDTAAAAGAGTSYVVTVWWRCGLRLVSEPLDSQRHAQNTAVALGLLTPHTS